MGSEREASEELASSYDEGETGYDDEEEGGHPARVMYS